MEEDNALDIIRWLFKDTTQLDCVGPLKLEQNARLLECEVRLRGNLLAIRPNIVTDSECVAEPLLVVCEKIRIERCDDNLNAFRLKYGTEELLFVCPKDDKANDAMDADSWILKLSMASHRIIQAEYDQAMHTHYTSPPETTAIIEDPSSPKRPPADPAFAKDAQMLRNYFLTNGFCVEHSFSVSQSAAAPNRRILCKEVINETKLSMIIPIEMVKLYLKWSTELRDDLLGNLWTVRNAVIVEALHTTIRHLNSNIDAYTQASEFLAGYTGNYFRSSTEKYRVAFGPVPTNLHVQHFSVNGREIGRILTSGVIAALPLRFSHGGLYRIRNKFNAGLEPAQLDHTDEARSYRRRSTLVGIKRQIGDLSRRLDNEWHVAEFGKVDKVGLNIYSEVIQIHEVLVDMVKCFPGVSNLVDALCEGGFAQLQRRSGDGSPNRPVPSAPRDSLGNQLDRLEAEMFSSKMAVIDQVDVEAENVVASADLHHRVEFEENAKSALHSTLDALHHLAESMLISQMLGLVLCFRKKPDCVTFFHLQLRHDILISQALAIVCTALLSSLDRSGLPSFAAFLNAHEAVERDSKIVRPCDYQQQPMPILLTFFSFLSCYGNEQGMIEDVFEALTMFPGFTEFRFVEASSSVSQTCIPQIDGHRTALRISLPLPASILKRFSESLPAPVGQWFRVFTVLWNVGINHEASLASTMGSAELEEVVNRTALRQMHDYIGRLEQRYCTNIKKSDEKSSEQMATFETVRKQLAELDSTVSQNPSRKNVSIFSRAMALSASLGGVPIISCKSGKDRTSMAVTLEEGRLLKETCGLSQKQTSEVVDSLRLSGVRRENCRRNIGRPMYAFSPFQLGFLPLEFRPPTGTYTNIIST